MKSQEYFISGIDTNCGKTFITGHLAAKLQSAGKKVITTKLIQTGCSIISEDIEEHRRLMNVQLLPEDLHGETCPYIFSFPASPHLAAEIDSREIDLNRLKTYSRKLSDNYEIILTEGAGGLMVPITRNYLTLDFVKETNLPLILVTSSKLGSINHTLLNLEICRLHNINLKFLIYNQFPQDDSIIGRETFAYLKQTISHNYPKVKLIHLQNIVNEYDNDGFDLLDLLTN
jgi:dethiobiotin synthetase